MKTFMMLAGGVAMAIIAFIGGVVASVYLLNAEPERVLHAAADTSGLWTTVPVRVDVISQRYERLPAQVYPSDRSLFKPIKTEPAIDSSTTAALPLATESAVVANNQHIEWCKARYRSYRVSDNSYTSYTGGARECVSPYSEPTATSSRSAQVVNRPQEALGEAAQVELVSAETSYNRDDHMRDCMNRYRSYRVEDNTYQPYDGGPRRQCF